MKNVHELAAAGGGGGGGGGGEAGEWTMSIKMSKKQKEQED